MRFSASLYAQLTINLLVVRTASKLTNLLTSRNVSDGLVQEHLTIITGNVKDPDSVTKTLFQQLLEEGRC
jgi:hypothetical protein